MAYATMTVSLWRGKEEIVFHANEHFLNRKNGNEQLRITDSSFEVIADGVKKYHLECQSTEDHTMLIRIFEYDAQIALDEGMLEGNRLIVTFPASVIIQLRGTSSMKNAV
ncbi:MAG: hypothetical protein ACI4CT_01930 [Lachnospiraceae bacterium]